MRTSEPLLATVFLCCLPPRFRFYLHPEIGALPHPIQEKQSKEDGIVAILEKVVKMQAIIGSALPTQKKFKEMQDELEYKKMQLENTQTTQERLKEVCAAEVAVVCAVCIAAPGSQA